MSEQPAFERNTRQRQVILEELTRAKSHPTAPALYELVRRRVASISLATVYRNLERLVEMGLVRKLELGGQAQYDANIEPHDHVRCVQCGRMDDLPLAPLDALLPGDQDFAGYSILGRRLEFYGICPGCRSTDPT